MNDIAELQAQLKLLTSELRSAQTQILKLEQRNKWKASAFVGIALVVASGLGSWTVNAFSSHKTLPASSSPETPPTKIKAPFEVDDELGRVIMRVRDGDAQLDRGIYFYNEAGRAVVDVTSIQDGGGGGKIRVTAAGAEKSAELDQATGITITGVREAEGITINRGAKKSLVLGAELGSKGAEQGGSIKLYDGGEKLAASFTAKTNGAALQIFGGTDKPVARLQTETAGASLTIFGAGTKPAATLETDTTGGSLKIYGATDKPTATLQSDGDGGNLWIRDKMGQQVAGVIASDNGGVVKVMKSDDPKTYTAINAVNAGLGMAIRRAGVRLVFAGASGENGEKGSVFVFGGGENPIAALTSYGGGKGLVAVFNQAAAPIAMLAESDKHPGGGNVTANDPSGNGIFSAGFTGEAGDACVTRKSGLWCMGTNLPLQMK